jgi:prophage maintenance system killer protein
MTNHKNKIIFKEKNKQIEIILQDETIWLNLNQISKLFEKEKSIVSKYINEIFESNELDRNLTVKKFLKEHKIIEYYDLDVILSLGYRINPKKATQFRIWTMNLLKNNIKEIEKTKIFSSEKSEFIEIIEKYSLVWKWIEEYDSGKIDVKTTRKERKKISYEEAKEAINELKNYLLEKKEASEIFGIERDRGLFESALNTIYQSFGGKELYPSFEEKAANLLYLVIKNHPFVDGNKRIGALLFLKFLYENLEKEEIFYKFNSNTLTALCYFVAASPAEQKKQVIKLIMNFISFDNF